MTGGPRPGHAPTIGLANRLWHAEPDALDRDDEDEEAEELDE